MISFIFGLALLTLPFLAVLGFKDKKIGFAFVLFFVILFHVILAILTQLLGIFYYNLIACVVLIANLILIFILLKKQNVLTRLLRHLRVPYNDNKNSLQTTCYSLLYKIDWALLFIIIVSFLYFWQIHFNYTGKTNLATDKVVSYHEEKNMKYVYPYFSDEWYAVSLIKNSINTHSLPKINPFDNSFFLNLELFFHSFISEIILILFLDPLTQYVILAIFINILIIVLCYLFLRLNKMPKLISAISALSLLYITCGANLPGLWHLIPFNIGIIMVLIMFIFISLKNLKMVFSSAILGFLFYPPLLVFYFLGLVFTFFEKHKKDILFKVAGYSLLFLFIFTLPIYAILMISPLANSINYIISRLFFISFSAPYISQYAIYNIILWPVIFLAILGIYFIFKEKKWLFFQFLLGVLMWVVYSLTTFRFMIEYERIVILTAIIISIIAGFGLFFLECYALSKGVKTLYLKYAEVFILILFLAFIPFYTQRENWKHLILLEPKIGLQGFPKAPANNYLTNEDLRIFKNIKNAKFLSLPWKGTVLGTATENYPIVTKEGTISIGKESIFNNFLSADCLSKKNIAKDLKIDYVYVYKFECQGFLEIDKSKENLYLYEIKFSN